MPDNELFNQVSSHKPHNIPKPSHYSSRHKIPLASTNTWAQVSQDCGDGGERSVGSCQSGQVSSYMGGAWGKRIGKFYFQKKFGEFPTIIIFCGFLSPLTNQNNNRGCECQPAVALDQWTCVVVLVRCKEPMCGTQSWGVSWMNSKMFDPKLPCVRKHFYDSGWNVHHYGYAQCFLYFLDFSKLGGNDLHLDQSKLFQ